MRETDAPREAVLCLGNFDGVHIGHRHLVSSVLAKRDELRLTHQSVQAGVWLFREPPTRFLGDTAIPQLSTTDEKLDIFASLGLDYAFLADFPSLRDTPPESFVKDMLRGECHCIFAICGFNFRFGQGARGTAELLAALMDGQAEVVERVIDKELAVSSSLIRKYIAEGDIEEATRLLGRPFSLGCQVLHGKRVGRTLGIPTANQVFPKGGICPSHGVYATMATIDGKRYRAISNVGVRPSFDDGDRVNCETHIFGYEGDLYGKKLKIEFYRHLRGEIFFAERNLLIEQIQKDIELTNRFFDSYHEVTP